MEEDFSIEWYTDIWTDFFTRFKKRVQKFDGTWVLAKPNTDFGDYHHLITLLPSMDRVTITVDYNDIRNAVIHQGDSLAGVNGEYKFTIYDHLAKQIEHNINQARRCAKLAVLRLVDVDYKIKYDDYITVEFSGILLEKEIPEINRELMNRIAKVDGVVIYRDETSKLIQLNKVYECNLGHTTETSVNKQNPPRKCSGFDRISKTYQKCEEEFLEYNEDLSKSDDIFEILIQQRTDRVTELNSPATIWVKIQGRDNVKSAIEYIQLGDFISVNGIIRAENSQERNTNKNILLFDYYIHASSIQKRPISELVQDDPQLKELAKVAVQVESEEEDYMKLVRSVAPDIYKPEGDVVSEAVLLACVGTDERTNPISGSRTRGELQIFLVGDPGTAKSSYGKWAVKAVSRAFYNSGDKTSKVSLVGGVKPSQKEGKPGKLSVGSYGLGKLVVADELEKMKFEDLQALSEPLQDDQSISLGKQGYYKHHQISVATIALANPAREFAKWDITQDIFANTKLPSWLLERFDAVFIVRDVQDDYTDLAKISFKARSMRTQMRSQEFNRVKDKQQFALQASKTSSGDLYSIGFMRHWIQYVRDNFHPNIWDSEECLQEIDKFYMQMRKYSIRTPKDEKEKDKWTRDHEIPAIEIRGYMAICRFAEAHARACHRNYCTLADAEAAINIVRISKMSAGLNTNSLLSGDKTDQDPELRDVKLKALQEQKYDILDRQKTGEGRTFTNELEKISWIPCTHPKCKGQGTIYDGEESEICPECMGLGGSRKQFTINDLRYRCSNSKNFPIGEKMFRIIFKRALTTGEIVLDQNGPVKLFMNTKTKDEVALAKMKLDDTVGKYRFLADEASKETVEGIHKRRLLARNPDLLKRLEEVDKLDDVSKKQTT